jgi:hypothetical protein
MLSFERMHINKFSMIIHAELPSKLKKCFSPATYIGGCKTFRWVGYEGEPERHNSYKPCLDPEF